MVCWKDQIFSHCYLLNGGPSEGRHIHNEKKFSSEDAEWSGLSLQGVHGEIINWIYSHIYCRFSVFVFLCVRVTVRSIPWLLALFHSEFCISWLSRGSAWMTLLFWSQSFFVPRLQRHADMMVTWVSSFQCSANCVIGQQKSSSTAADESGLFSLFYDF